MSLSRCTVMCMYTLVSIINNTIQYAQYYKIADIFVQKQDREST